MDHSNYSGASALIQQIKKLCVCRCIGRKFALQQAVLLLTMLFQRYTVTVDEAHHPPGKVMRQRTGITFQPDIGGLWVKLHPRSDVSRSEE